MSDASYLLRRSRFGPLTKSALAKRKLDLLELFDSLCTDVYLRHDDFPETHNAVCSDLWEEDEDMFIDGLIKAWGKEEGTAGEAICGESFGVCSKAELKEVKAKRAAATEL